MPSQDLKQSTTTTSMKRTKKNRYQITSNQAKEEGWNWNEDPPEPKSCEFCGKTLYIGIISASKQTVFTWLKEPEHCAEEANILGKLKQSE